MSYDLANDFDTGVRFDMENEQIPVLEFSDPSYARASSVLFFPKTGALEAVLFDRSYAVGVVPEDMRSVIGACQVVYLRAEVSDGSFVRLAARLSVVEVSNDLKQPEHVTKKPELEIFPVFSAGGSAMTTLVYR